MRQRLRGPRGGAGVVGELAGIQAADEAVHVHVGGERDVLEPEEGLLFRQLDRAGVPLVAQHVVGGGARRVAGGARVRPKPSDRGGRTRRLRWLRRCTIANSVPVGVGVCRITRVAIVSHRLVRGGGAAEDAAGIDRKAEERVGAPFLLLVLWRAVGAVPDRARLPLGQRVGVGGGVGRLQPFHRRLLRQRILTRECLVAFEAVALAGRAARLAGGAGAGLPKKKPSVDTCRNRA